MGGSDSPRVLLERRLRWLVEVLCGSSVFCWWLLSMGLVAMMLSLYLFIRASLVLSLTVEKWAIITNKVEAQTKSFLSKMRTQPLGKKLVVLGWRV